jgi:hypothetical protein
LVDFDLLCGRVSFVAIPKGKKPGKIITIRVGDETGKGAKAAAAVKISKRWDPLRPATAFQDPQRRQQ